jgi:predicted metal-binding protein
MDTFIINALKYAARLGMDACVEFDPKLLEPQQSIRDLCTQNKCGYFNKHYMCPPYIGSLGEIKAKLRNYQKGILIQHPQPLDVMKDREGLIQSKIAFHRTILNIEDYCRNIISLRGTELEHIWGLIGGTCELCRPCKAAINEPCPYPQQARTSLEALGVDVVRLLKEHGLDCDFHPDRITWTGCLLFRKRSLI